MDVGLDWVWTGQSVAPSLRLEGGGGTVRKLNKKNLGVN